MSSLISNLINITGSLPSFLPVSLSALAWLILLRSRNSLNSCSVTLDWHPFHYETPFWLSDFVGFWQTYFWLFGLDKPSFCFHFGEFLQLVGCLRLLGSYLLFLSKTLETQGGIILGRSWVFTLYNVCSVHREMFNTSGDVQYIGVIPIPWVLRGYHEYIRGVQYIGGIPWVHRGMFSTSEGYHEYIGGCSVHRRDTMSTSGGGGGYHEYIGGISSYMWGVTMST